MRSLTELDAVAAVVGPAQPARGAGSGGCADRVGPGAALVVTLEQPELAPAGSVMSEVAEIVGDVGRQLPERDRDCSAGAVLKDGTENGGAALFGENDSLRFPVVAVVLTAGYHGVDLVAAVRHRVVALLAGGDGGSAGGNQQARQVQTEPVEVVVAGAAIVELQGESGEGTDLVSGEAGHAQENRPGLRGAVVEVGDGPVGSPPPVGGRPGQGLTVARKEDVDLVEKGSAHGQ